MANEPVESTGVFVNDLGVVKYMINDMQASRDDFNALTLARIAAALEGQLQIMSEDDGEAPESTADNLFGV